MRLAISRQAAPDMPLSRVAALAREQGIDGVEIDKADLDATGALDDLAGLVVGIRVESLSTAASARVARVAAKIGAPVIVARGAARTESLAALDAVYRHAGARLCVSHGTDIEECALLVDAIARAGASALSVAWEIDPARDDLRDAPAVLLATTHALRYIRLRGGGPELSDSDGKGMGDAIASIARSRYSGTMTLAPTSQARAREWERWLAGKAKTGCGTAYAKMHARNIALDIRPVEPKDRLETILGAYRALTPGRTLHVTFDHDPSCMYFTLQATEPEGSFVFERRDDGPEVWTVDVMKRT